MKRKNCLVFLVTLCAAVCLLSMTAFAEGTEITS